jgi:small multidrug resistance pump
MTGFGWLALAIASEVAATISLKLSAGCTRPGPTIVMLIGFVIALHGLARAVVFLPLGMVYAIWAGLGTVGAVIAGHLLLGEAMGAWQLAGIVIVIAGVAMLNVGRVSA